MIDLTAIDSDENHVVNISGGRTSAFLAHIFESAKKYKDLKVEYVFCDTGAEHPKTYEFIRNIVDHWDIELTCLRTVITNEYGVGPSYQEISLDDCKQDLKPFFDVCKKHGTPTVAAPLCSDRLKSIPSDKYCDDKYGKHNYLRWIGFRADERSRIKSVEQQLDFFQESKSVPKRLKNTRYLAQISDFEKEDILDWWLYQPFNLELDEHLGNCVFCIKKGANKLALAARDEPEMAADFIKMVDDPRVATRVTRKDIPNNVMYRNNQSLESIIESHKNFSRLDIMNTIRKNKRFENNSCSESCEPTYSYPDLYSQ